MSDSFWAWLIAGGGIGAVSAATLDRYAAPWAAGCVVAAGLEAAHLHPGWQWAAFLLVSAAISVRFNRVPRYSGRHTRKRGA